MADVVPTRRMHADATGHLGRPVCPAGVAEAARAHGFQQGFTVQGVAVTPEAHPMLLGRRDAKVDGPALFARRLVQLLCRTKGT